MKHLSPLLLALTLSTQAQTPLTGFAPATQTRQERYERDFKASTSAERFKAHLQVLCQVPHLAGTPENEKVRDYLVATMKAAGWQVDVYPHDILLPKGPGDIAVELVEPTRQPLNIREYILPEDKYSSHPLLTPGWNAWSGSGDVTAGVVYANFGRKEDFETLAELGVSVKGKIVLARYGGNFRGYKARFAQAAGAAGLLIYTDPEDTGYRKGIPFPEGPQHSESTIQRGSLLTVPFTGDALTPFEPALPLDGKIKIKRADPASVGFHQIPVTPIPYGSAQEILKRMTGAGVPAGWQGGLPFAYRVDGGAALKVRLMVKQEKVMTRVHQVVGTLPGSEFPDEWIVLGSHYDAWGFGAMDPNSGTAMLLSLTESLGKLAKTGQHPRRTIKVAHWDAEEAGVIGSTEYVEQFRDELSKKAVAYFNADAAVTGKTFVGQASPSLKNLALDAAKAVEYPDSGKTVYAHWLSSRKPGTDEPALGNLGGGSDHIAFYMHAGVPSLNVGTTGPTPYHSVYDDLYYYEKFANPTYKLGPMVEQVFSTMATRLANADLIPYDVSRYATDLTTHLKTVESRIKAYSPDFSAQKLLTQVETLKATAAAYEAAAKRQLAAGPLERPKTAALNEGLRGLEKAFLDEKGMAFGAWYRSLYAAPDPNSGYAEWMLPAFQYEASLKSTANLPAIEARYAGAISSLNDRIAALTQQLGGGAAVGGAKE